MDKYLLVYRFNAETTEIAEEFAAQVTKDVLAISQHDGNGITGIEVALTKGEVKDE